MNIKEILFILVALLIFGWVGAVVAFVLVVGFQMLLSYLNDRENRRTQTYRWIR